jgi:hypothetical protein
METAMATNHEKETDRARAATYDAFKAFEGRRYTGMKVGGRHTWHYDAGVWKERKVAPDRWEISYAVPKRRAGKAPQGSGVPVGTEYHWFIVAHQNVRKLDANTYSTAMTGLKYKVAHKRAGSETWSASEAAQRRALVRILRETIRTLEEKPTPSAPEPAPALPRDAGRTGSRRRAVRAVSPGARSRRVRGR